MAEYYEESTRPEVSEGIGRKAREGALWMGSLSVIWQSLSWVITILTARFLLPTDYGVMSLAETFTPYLGLLATLSIGTWLIQANGLDSRDIGSAALFGSVLSAGVAMFAFLICPLLADFYGDPSLTKPFRLIVGVFFLKGLAAVPDALLRRELRFKALSILSLSIVVLRGLLQLILAILGYGYWALIWGMVISECLTCLVTIILGRQAFVWNFNPEIWKKILRFGIPSSLSALCWIVFTSADNIIVGKFFGVEALGIYAMAYYLSNLPLQKMNTMFRSVAFSYLSRLKGSEELFQNKALELTRVLCLLIFPVLVGLFLVSENAIPLVFGAKWAPLVHPLRFLCIASLFRVAVDPLPSVLSAQGDAVLAFHTQLVAASTLPIAFLISANMFGMNGIYATWILLFPLIAFLMVIMSKRSLQISPSRYFRNLRAPLTSSLLMGLIVFCSSWLLTMAKPSPIANLCVSISAGIVSYVAILWFFYRADFDAFVNFFKNRETQEGI